MQHRHALCIQYVPGYIHTGTLQPTNLQLEAHVEVYFFAVYQHSHKRQCKYSLDAER